MQRPVDVGTLLKAKRSSRRAGEGKEEDVLMPAPFSCTKLSQCHSLVLRLCALKYNCQVLISHLESLTSGMGDRGTLTTCQINQVDPTHLAVFLPFQYLQILKSFFPSFCSSLIYFHSPINLLPPLLVPPPIPPLVPPLPLSSSLPSLLFLSPSSSSPPLSPLLSSPLLTHRGLCKHDGEHRVRSTTPVVHASGCCCTETVAKVDPALRETGNYIVSCPDPTLSRGKGSGDL